VTEKIRTMSLPARTLAKIASGTKTVEVRVAYPNNEKLHPGQLLRFLGRDTDIDCLTRIIRVSRYGSFDDMLDAEDPATIGFDMGMTREDMLAREREIYPPHKEALGVLAIEIERVASDYLRD
jgi:ASC-1-like (ASCH) protein